MYGVEKPNVIDALLVVSTSGCVT